MTIQELRRMIVVVSFPLMLIGIRISDNGFAVDQKVDLIETGVFAGDPNPNPPPPPFPPPPFADNLCLIAMS